MADTRVKYWESRRDHRLPSAFRTSRAPHQTEMSRRRSRSGLGASRKARDRRKEKLRRQRVTSPDRRDGLEESRSGGTRDRPGRGSRRDPVRCRTGPPLRALVHAGARGSLRVWSGTYGAYPLPPKVTGGRPIPDRSVGMSTDGALVARHGVRRTTDGQARGGGPDPESPHRHS